MTHNLFEKFPKQDDLHLDRETDLELDNMLL